MKNYFQKAVSYALVPISAVTFTYASNKNIEIGSGNLLKAPIAYISTLGLTDVNVNESYNLNHQYGKNVKASGIAPDEYLSLLEEQVKQSDLIVNGLVNNSSLEQDIRQLKEMTNDARLDDIELFDSYVNDGILSKEELKRLRPGDYCAVVESNDGRVCMDRAQIIRVPSHYNNLERELKTAKFNQGIERKEIKKDNWFKKHPILASVLGVVVVGGIIAAAKDNGKDTPTDVPAESNGTITGGNEF